MKFSATKTFLSINPPPPEVSWHRFVWFTGRIPKHSFITWLAAHDRLATRDRIRRYSPTISATCLLCHIQDETRDHLFFSCQYSCHLLQIVFHMIPAHYHLHDILQWLPRSSPSRHLKLIAHLLLQAALYSLWRERNSRLHTGASKPPELLCRDIKMTVKAKLLGIALDSRVSITDSDSPTLLEAWFGLQDHDPRFGFHS